MGIDLVPVAGHNISFEEKSFHQLVKEIKTNLDHIIFPNARFLRTYTLSLYRDNKHAVRSIRSIKTNKEWTIHGNDHELAEQYFENEHAIDFNGPFDFILTFDPCKITFCFGYRYYDWFFQLSQTFRDEWRKYMYQVVRQFGGDRVIYLADPHDPLSNYIDFTGNFKDMETALTRKLGKPIHRYECISGDMDESLFIDLLDDMDWGYNEPIDQYLPEPDDTSSTDFDLSVYSKKSNLKKLDYQSKCLLHKKEGKDIHFYHIANELGLLLIHKGIVNGQDEYEVRLDKYAPFIYDELEEELISKGYGTHMMDKYGVYINLKVKSENWNTFLEEYKSALIWSGVGIIYSSIGYVKGVEYKFNISDEKTALKILLDEIKNNSFRGQLKFIRYDKNGETGTVIFSNS